MAVPLSNQPKSSGTRVQSCDFCRKKREAYNPIDDPTQCLYCWYNSKKTGIDRRCTFSGSFIPGKRNDLHDPAANSSGKEHEASRAQKKKASVQKKSSVFTTTHDQKKPSVVTTTRDQATQVTDLLTMVTNVPTCPSRENRMLKTHFLKLHAKGIVTRQDALSKIH